MFEDMLIFIVIGYTVLSLLKSRPLFLSLLGVAFAFIALFFTLEYRKKSLILLEQLQSAPHVEYYYPGGASPGMKKIVLRSATNTPFCATMGFALEWPDGMIGHDPIAQACSDKGVIVFETYFGNDPVLFQFGLNSDVEVKATSTKEDQMLPADSRSPPHWYQKLGVYS